VGTQSEAITFSNEVDSMYPEVGNLRTSTGTDEGSCSAIALPRGIIVAAAHCVGPWHTDLGPAQRIPRESLGEYFFDADGDFRTKADQVRYLVRGGYRVSIGPDGQHWDLAVLAVHVPQGEPGPFERAYAIKGEAARHRLVTSSADSTTPADLADLVVHVPFNPNAVFSSHHPTLGVRVGVGFNNIILDDAGAPTNAFSPVAYNDAGKLIQTGTSLAFRLRSPGEARSVYSDGRLWVRSLSATSSHIEHGDSGGPFLATGSALGFPAPFNTSHEFLIGNASSAGTIDGIPAGLYADAFIPERGRYMEARIRQLHADGDTDGIVDAHDNCPDAPNPDQANCNAIAEGIHGASVLGDACDPVPCPGASMSRIRNVGSNFVCGSGHRLAGKFCFGRLDRNSLVQNSVGSSPIPSHEAPATRFVPLRGFPYSSATLFRFCEYSTDCSLPENTTRQANNRNDPEDANDPGIWRAATLSAPATARSGFRSVENGVDRTIFSWDVANDAEYWTTLPTWRETDEPNGCIRTAPSALHPTGICLHGLFWEFTHNQIGASVVTVGSNVVGIHGDHLPSSLFQVNPYQDGGRYEPGIGWHEALRRPVILTLPDPPWWSSVALSLPYEAGEANILSALDGKLLFVHPDGSIDTSGSAMSGDLNTLLTEFETMPEATPTQQWIDLADPVTREDRPLSVVARKQANGTWKFDSIVTYYGGMIVESEYGNPLRYGSAASLPSGPIVYSPEDDALWTAGTGTLSRHAAGATAFTNVLTSGGVLPMTVKALAFDAVRQVAWIVDYDGSNVPRILRYAKDDTGAWIGSVVATAGIVGAADDTYYLHVTRSGDLMYARTNIASNIRTIARLSYEVNTLYATILTGGPAYGNQGGSGMVSGALLARPLLDGTGYHQMIAGEDLPVTSAARSARGSARSAAAAAPEGTYTTADPNVAGVTVPVSSVLR
jgi:hypothetical protein